MRKIIDKIYLIVDTIFMLFFPLYIIDMFTRHIDDMYRSMVLIGGSYILVPILLSRYKDKEFLKTYCFFYGVFFLGFFINLVVYHDVYENLWGIFSLVLLVILVLSYMTYVIKR